MTRMVCWSGILALALLAGCGKKDEQVVTPQGDLSREVSIWVDDVGITGAQIQNEVRRLFSHVQDRDMSPEQLQLLQVRLLNQAVDNLVLRQLVRGEMDRSGVLVSQEEVEKGKADLEKGLGEGQSLAMLLAAANLPMDELEMNLRLDLFKNKVLKDRQIEAVESVTDEDVRKYYDEHPLEFTLKEGRLVSHILVRVPEDADEATLTDRRAKAEGLRTALLEGADFKRLAMESSECASRTRGGDLGLVPKGREAPEFEAAVYSQPIGEIGEVVQSPVGFHVIKVTGEQERKLVPFDDVKNKLSIALKTRARQKVAADYLKELRENAAIKLDGQLALLVEQAKAAQAEADAKAAAEDKEPVSILEESESAPSAVPGLP